MSRRSRERASISETSSAATIRSAPSSPQGVTDPPDQLLDGSPYGVATLAQLAPTLVRHKSCCILDSRTPRRAGTFPYLRHGNRHRRLGHRVHRRGHQRGAQADVPRDLAVEIDIVRTKMDVTGQENYVVVAGEVFRDERERDGTRSSGRARDTYVNEVP